MVTREGAARLNTSTAQRHEGQPGNAEDDDARPEEGEAGPVDDRVTSRAQKKTAPRRPRPPKAAGRYGDLKLWMNLRIACRRSDSFEMKM